VQSTRHDGNLAALHASSLPGYVLDVVVLTADGGLLATLREASSPEHAIWHAPSADAAVDYLVGGRCGILVADLGTLRGDAASLLARLHSQFPELVLMATGRRDEEAAVAPLVSDGRIYRFLHKPISPARANLFLGAATRRYYELRDTDEPMMLATVKTMAQRPRTLRLVGAIAAVLVIAAVAVWLLLRPQHPDPAREQAIANAARTEGQIQELLARANMALATGRLIEPRANNALELYREVLALAPNHPEAATGEQRVLAALEAKVVAALQTRDPRAGAAALTALQRAEPNHPRYEQLYKQLIELSRSQPPAAPPRTAPSSARASTTQPTVSAAPAEITQAPEESPVSLDEPLTEDESFAPLEEPSELSEEPPPRDAREDALEQLALAIRLRERGLLIEPAENNAFDALTTLRSEYPDIREIADEQRRLAAALIEHARTLLAASDLDATARYLDKAAELEPASSVVRSLRAQHQAALSERESERVIPAGALKRTREVSPEYPYDAQIRRVTGWVDVEFTIATDGTTRDLVVRDAEPKNVFDRSAVEALRRWRFEPISRNGQLVEQRAILRLKYELEK
jgi:TonB family protein